VIRWFKFSAVGIAGAGVQLVTLSLLLKLHLNYLPATALAVETALLHNYVWHSLWTWRGRPGSLWRFQLSNGMVSICSNLILMRVLTGWAGIPAVPANLAAIAITSVLNFWLADRWVFYRSALRAASTVARSESLGSEETIGRTIQPRPVGMSRESEIARHSIYRPSRRGSISQ
jgi:putative flippase GtrA